MKLIKIFITLSLVLSIPGITYAAEPTSVTRSAGKLVNDNSLSLTEKLANSPVVEASLNKQRSSTGTIESSQTQQFRLASHGLLTEFEIYDAWVELTGDIDNDGFYHNIKATFDADVNTSVETVYAKLYLSYEGGAWMQYASSDLFEIYYDSENDTYEVISELIDGYSPGYYDVLIELHSFYHDGIVASRVITQDIDGYSITLEDRGNDEVYRSEVYYEETEYYVGSGSFSWFGLLLLGFLVLIKLRYFNSNKNTSFADTRS